MRKARPLWIPASSSCHEIIIFSHQGTKPQRRLDVFVEELIICELKAVDEMNPLWEAQLLSHLKLTGKRLGFLINFNVAIIKKGIQRIIL